MILNTGVRQRENAIKTFLKTLQIYMYIMHMNIHTTNKSAQVNVFVI